MKLKVIYIAFVFCVMACNASSTINDWHNFEQGNWKWNDTITYSVNIDNIDHYYNIYSNIRIQNTYNYENIWFKIDCKLNNESIFNKQIMKRVMNDNGKWTGQGIGDIFSYQNIAIANHKFSKPGIYQFKIIQNMRDSVLSGVLSAGIKIEKGSEALK